MGYCNIIVSLDKLVYGWGFCWREDREREVDFINEVDYV